MIPARSYLMVRDVALYEYISSLCHISRSETSRLSGGTHKNKRRRYVLKIWRSCSITICGTSLAIVVQYVSMQGTGCSTLLEYWFIDVVS